MCLALVLFGIAGVDYAWNDKVSEEREIQIVEEIEAVAPVVVAGGVVAVSVAAGYISNDLLSEEAVNTEGLNQSQTADAFLQEVRDADDKIQSSYAPLRNRNEDLEQVGLGKYQVAVSKAVCEGKNLSTAKELGNESVNEHASVIQANGFEVTNSAAQKINASIEVVENTTDLTVTIGGHEVTNSNQKLVSPDSLQPTLVNGTTIETPTYVDNIDNNNITLYGTKIEVLQDGSSLGTAKIEGIFTFLNNDVPAEAEDVRQQGATYATDIYNQGTNKSQILDSLNVSTCSEIPDPTVVAGTSATDSVSFAEAVASQAGYNTTAEPEMKIRVYDNTSDLSNYTDYEQASLVTRAKPDTTKNNNTTWISDHVYNRSEFSENIYVYYKNENDTIESLSINENDDGFEIVDGAEFAEYDPNKYKTYNSSEYLEQLSRTVESIEETQEELEDGGGGSGLPGGNTILLLLGGALVVVYLLSRNGGSGTSVVFGGSRGGSSRK